MRLGVTIKNHVAVAALALAGAVGAHAEVEDPINADRPGIADGSKVVGHGRLQVEAGFQQEFRRTARMSEHRAMAPLLVRAGIRPQWELRVETNSRVMQFSRDAAGAVVRAEGWAPVALGAKYQITGFTQATAPSLGLIGRVVPASGSGSFRSRRTGGDLRLAADWDFAQGWSLNPNVGFARVEDEEGQAFFAGLLAATLGYNPTPSLNLFVDAGLQSRERRSGGGLVIVDAGVAYLITRDVQLDVSAGKGVRGNTTPRAFVSAGISARY